MKVALIDLGTNSVRLYIYKTGKKARFQRLLKTRTMVRLGDGLFETGRLSEGAKIRTMTAFEEFAEIIATHKPDLVRAVATSAMRVARDRKKLVSAIRDSTGIEVEIISGKEEARLIALGVQSTLKLYDENYLLVDIGGGSTEITLLVDKQAKYSNSLPLGAARDQQTFLCQVPPIQYVTGKGVAALRKHVARTLIEYVPRSKYQSAETVIGTSGSIRAYHNILARQGMSSPIFQLTEFRELLANMKSMTREELLHLPRLEAKRTDLILSAGIILDEICRHFKCKQVYTTSASLKDGLLAELAS